ncbi:hypothetical protein BH11BAC2_BH11BAC2_02720 [soil metagenome]
MDIIYSLFISDRTLFRDLNVEMKMKSTVRYRLLWALKLAAFFLSVLYIGYHINSRVSLLEDGKKALQELTEGDSLKWFSLALFLMLLNWALETRKWQLLVKPIEQEGFLRSARSVLTGITISFYTPNRIGEFAGRMLHMEPGHRVRGALAAFIGSSAQLLVTLQAGLLAVAIMAGSLMSVNSTLIFLIRVLLVSSCFSITYFWFRLSSLTKLFDKFSWLRKYKDYGDVFAKYHQRELLITWLFSIARYLVFSTQQFLLLKAFHVSVDYFTCLELSALSFLVITLIPSVALGELGLRGGVNLAVFGRVTSDSSAILIATFTLWCINLALPALLGAVSLLYIRISDGRNAAPADHT